MYRIFLGVVPISNYLLKLYLRNVSIRFIDIKPYLKKKDFEVLKNVNLFNNVSLNKFDEICWNDLNLKLSKEIIISNMY
ncbi:DUF2442 domain-containing protein [Clostridium perfringens]|uniref:DUF2442 domain-containing protein n=1 Tax=Clostridium perfringens TaxID=1502 RepID=UPI001A1C8B5D|nr:DUF2442 domain-containing protein [Clostridium perfringens]MBO3326978.1 DUF2442 domain-containing protein [Clostridium perfringens]HAT4262576.1 DUF2442 domain-containing protein [Clostridium perfringens]HAT4356370.1 DUF2442 domain-containing protein [Clostridium perfringens]